MDGAFFCWCRHVLLITVCSRGSHGMAALGWSLGNPRCFKLFRCGILASAYGFTGFNLLKGCRLGKSLYYWCTFQLKCLKTRLNKLRSLYWDTRDVQNLCAVEQKEAPSLNEVQVRPVFESRFTRESES